jgi:replicative DNA helicase
MKIKGNLGVERVVLAGLCQFGKEAYFDIIDIVSTNSFSLEANQAIYKCIEKALQQVDKLDATSLLAASDSLGLSTQLTKNKVDVEYIRSLFSFPIKLENIRPHAKQLAKIEIIQKEQIALMEAYNKLGTLDGTESINEILSVPETAIFDVINDINNRNDESPKQIVDGARLRLEALAANPIKNIGIPTPFAIYNKIIGGGIRSGVALIAARPKQGKSTLAINIGLHVAEILNIPVLFVDTEMIKTEQENRVIACHSNLEIDLIETGNFALYESHAETVKKTLNILEKIPFEHKFVGGKPFEEILSLIRRWIYQSVGFNDEGKTNPHLIIYDYFKLMDASSLEKMQEYQSIGFQISALSDFCKKYDTPCLAFTQVNRDGISKDTSDIISQSDRLLWLCTSCSVFKRLSKEEIVENGGPKYGNRRLVLLEGRFGEPLEEGDSILMQFDGKKSKILEIGTKFNLQRNRPIKTGFEMNDDDTSGENISEH